MVASNYMYNYYDLKIARFSPSLHPSIDRWIDGSIYLSIYLSIYRSIYLSILRRIYIHMSEHPSVSAWICLLYPYIYLSIYLFICSFVRPSVRINPFTPRIGAARCRQLGRLLASLMMMIPMMLRCPPRRDVHSVVAPRRAASRCAGRYGHR